MQPFSSFGRGIRRWRWILVGAYAAAWVAGSVAGARGAAPSAPPSAPPGTTIVSLLAVDGLRRSTQPVRLAFYDAVGTTSGGTPIVLLHGSPGDAAVFDQPRPFLGDRRVIVPDLPGFGASTRDIPDYSFRAHAIYVDDLLSRLGIVSAHVLGFSMGGGVALHLADRDPARVTSVTLLSAIGVQEMELFGQYHVNHALHAAQLGVIRLLGAAVPSAGAGRAYSYARNFYESDQRPLRAVLQRLDVPVLILHGRRDPQVPPEAAVEHARLVPQSELQLFDQTTSCCSTTLQPSGR